MLAITAGGLAGRYSAIRSSSPVQMVTKEDKIYIEENSALVSIAKTVEPSVAGIKVSGKTGSGLVLTSDGLTVTLASLVPAGSEADVNIKGGDNNAYQVLKRDNESNLALLKLSAAGLSTDGFYDLSKLEIGMRVFVLSNNGGSYSIDEGIVKSFDSDVIKTNIYDSGEMEGSPVFDIMGNVIGLAYGKSGAVYAVPVTKLRAFAGL